MSYTLTETDDGASITNPDGTEIWSDTVPYEWPNDAALEAILNDANFGSPQRAAIKAVMGLIDHDDQTV